jgi:hypothetical protein
MEVQITCKYCGYKCIKDVYTPKTLEGARCEKCLDKNLTIVDLSKIKIDTYIGAPPFLDDDSDPEDQGMGGVNDYPWNSGGD